MGFNFRKSIKMGPVRVNLSKSGVGYSVGGKGFRVTKKADGGTRTTASIPGTGISYTKDVGSTRKNKSTSMPAVPQNTSDYGNENNQPEASLIELILCLFLGWIGAHKFYRKKKGMGILYFCTFGLLGIGWLGDTIQLSMTLFRKNRNEPLPKTHKIGAYIVAFFCVLILGSCGSEPESTEIPPETAIATTSVIEEPTLPSETAVPTEATSEVTEISALTEAITEPATEPATEATETEPTGTTYILNTNSKKFHYEWCSSADNIKESNKKILTTTRDDVISRGYEPCGRCNP